MIRDAVTTMDLRKELPSESQAEREAHLGAFDDHGLVVPDHVDTLGDDVTPGNGRLREVVAKANVD
ncbi:hypothetical protein GT045_26585 [Streptomyces sp. SID486]|uniref:hypothetical protein n=1 Tax=Streptomyces sp. SID486 TaxID=2690264 RepID=UPI00136D9F86|nr:hypothetical protein [Streptomyces sp. SID486]MYX98279.1 hypothetical protein [Streptomyces sp. SID486]